MRHNRLTVMLLLFMLIAGTLLPSGASAQAQITPQPPGEPPAAGQSLFNEQVTGLSATFTDGVLTVAVTGVHLDGCMAPLIAQQVQQGEALVITLLPDPDAPQMGVPCTNTPQPFALDVLVEQQYESIAALDGLVLDVNGYAVRVFGQTILTGDTPVPTQGTAAPAESRTVQLDPLVNSPLVVELAVVVVNDTSASGFGVQVSGYFPDGCEAPLVARQVVDENTRTLRVSIYRLLPDAFMACPAVLWRYDAMLPLEAPLEGLYTLDVNGLIVRYDFSAQREIPEGMSMARVLHQIDSVEALILESFPPQVNLLVRGIQPDGCMYPVLIDQQRDGDTITVEIYRELPPDIMCTMQIVAYEETISLGALESGRTYTISVNGFTLQVTL